MQWLLANGATLAEKNNDGQSAMDLTTDPNTKAFLKEFAAKHPQSPAATSAAPHAAFFQSASSAAQAASATARSSATAGLSKP